MKILKTLLVSLSCAVLLTACGDDDDNIKYGGDTGGGTQQNVSGATGRIEVPALKSGNVFVSHWTVENGDSTMSYCFEYDGTKQHTRWVAYRFDGVTRAQNTSRTDAWADDPSLPSSMQIGKEYFDGYQRGHICPSADRVYSEAANQQTFYMSNMSPMSGDFNTGIWSKLETLVRNKGHKKEFADTLYVVKGGTIDNSSYILKYINRPNGKKVPVPKYFYTALVRVKNGTYTGIAFLLEHRSYSESEAQNLSKYALTIDELEEFTGIDFFPNLPDAIERAVESSYTSSYWF